MTSASENQTAHSTQGPRSPLEDYRGSRTLGFFSLLVTCALSYLTIVKPVLDAQRGAEEIAYYPVGVGFCLMMLPFFLGVLIGGNRFTDGLVVLTNRAAQRANSDEQAEHVARSVSGQLSLPEAVAKLSPMGKAFCGISVVVIFAATLGFEFYLESFGYDL